MELQSSRTPNNFFSTFSIKSPLSNNHKNKLYDKDKKNKYLKISNFNDYYNNL